MTGADAVAAGDVLAAELDALADRGLRTPCQREPEAWFTEHRAHQAEAAAACLWCPLIEPCRNYADVTGQTHGVWGGVPRPVRPNPQTDKES